MWKIQPGVGNDYVTKTFRLPTDLAGTLEALAFQNNLSLNQLVIQSLRYALNNLEVPMQNDVASNQTNLDGYC